MSVQSEQAESDASAKGADVSHGHVEDLGVPGVGRPADPEPLTWQDAVCECGVVDGPELPVLDAREIPHAIRHATIFGALDSLEEGGGLVLVAPHDPFPLLAQLEARSPGVFAMDYLESGPEKWRLRFRRA